MSGPHADEAHWQNRPDTPTSPEPAAAPQVDTAMMRGFSKSCDLMAEQVVPQAARIWSDRAERLRAAADELDTHRARHAALVALVAEWRASGEAATENAGLAAVMLARADELARILGEQP